MLIIKPSKIPVNPISIYNGIENLIEPELLFDLIAWSDNKFGQEKIKYTISFSHNAISEKLLPVFGSSMYALSKGLISLGEIALAKTYGLCDGQVKYVEANCAGSRTGHNVELLNKALRGIEHVMHSSKAKSDLNQLYSKYRGNKYIDLLPTISNTGTTKIQQQKLVLLDEIKTPCVNITTNCLDDRMFLLKRDKMNVPGNTRISSTIALINQVFRKEVRPKDTPPECYRGAYVAGLYILAKWICENKLVGVDEIYLGSIIQEIRLIMTDFYNHKSP
ncbi:MAG: hypothetical protein GY775_14390 [Candidatus Scalindua sp.]|nr:hypothetical protein [Candidatus Scalindua sp.]